MVWIATMEIGFDLKIVLKRGCSADSFPKLESHKNKNMFRIRELQQQKIKVLFGHNHIFSNRFHFERKLSTTGVYSAIPLT